MRTILKTIVAVIALTVLAPGYAETGQVASEQLVSQAQDSIEMNIPFQIVQPNTFTSKDYDCLARNIYHEAANEPEEGKVAVGMVTLNRAYDSRFPGSICSVVNQRTTLDRVRTVTKKIKTVFSERNEKQQIREKVTICQFSWKCEKVRLPRDTDARWEECKRVARELLDGGYTEYRIKYQTAMYFHATFVKPTWSKQKQHINKIGGHIFYADK